MWFEYFVCIWAQLHTAFSREQPDKKVYVTHLLKDHGEYIWRILGEENGHLYVCG
jgi:NADPH-ferrihemoprotein reductase